MQTIRITQVHPHEKQALRQFIEFPRTLHTGDSAWIQPLSREVARKLDPTVSPFYQYGSVTLYAAYDGHDRMCGRIAAIINPWHKRLHGEAAGFFGLFECINESPVARALLEFACDHLEDAGCSCVIGPVNLSTNDESGFLIEGYEFPPTFMCSYTLPYYHELMEMSGFSKLIDTLAYETRHGHKFPDKYYRAVARAGENSHIRIRRFSCRTAAYDIQQIRDVYNESFRTTWGFVPISEGEAEELGRGLLQFADLDLVWLAFYDDRPVGFILGFPDLNEILRFAKGRLGPMTLLRILLPRWSMHGMRVAGFGVLPEFRALGIEAALIWRVHDRINRRPYERIEFSVVMENNQRMRHLLEAIGFTQTKRYRLYRKEL